MESILKNPNYHYLIRPLIDTNDLTKLYQSITLKNKQDIASWEKDDKYFTNIYINSSYLHIQKYKKDRYTLSIFSSIKSENIDNKSYDDDIQDKSWCILKKKIYIEELVSYLKNDFLKDYEKHWLTRKDKSSEYDEKKISNNFTEFWLKCMVE